MFALRTLLPLAVVLMGALAAAGEEPVTVTTFALKDGRKVEALRYVTFSAGDFKTFVVTALDGKKLTLLGKDVASQQEELVPFDKLPEAARQDVAKVRAAAAAARAAAEARAADEKAVAAAKRRENEVQAGLNKTADELKSAQELQTKAELAVRNAVTDIAKADARYDGAKTELGSLSGVYDGYSPYSWGNPRRGDYLRALMTHAAEEKTMLQYEKQDAEAVVARVKETLPKLEARVAAAQNELAAAKAETKQVILKMKERAAASSVLPDSELTIRTAPVR
ncbi:MAG: hypothetical protein NTW87_27180 [Planctomycetota bacterium]|nr:hypothetical protein [Planctomycetota bacterium]